MSHYDPNALRRLATELFGAAGLRQPRAAEWARTLLWYEITGLTAFGLARLPEWLERLRSGEIDPEAEERIVAERASTAQMRADRCPPALALGRGAEIAGQKARDTGLGLVRITGLPECPGPAAAAVVTLAIGPNLGAAVGPSGHRAVALPSIDGFPIVYDSALVEAPGGEEPASGFDALEGLVPWGPWTADGDVCVTAVSILAFEPLEAFLERVKTPAFDGDRDEPPAGWLLPDRAERNRKAAERSGLKVEDALVERLKTHCRAADRAFPDPVEGS